MAEDSEEIDEVGANEVPEALEEQDSQVDSHSRTLPGAPDTTPCPQRPAVTAISSMVTRLGTAWPL